MLVQGMDWNGQLKLGSNDFYGESACSSRAGDGALHWSQFHALCRRSQQMHKPSIISHQTSDINNKQPRLTCLHSTSKQLPCAQA